MDLGQIGYGGAGVLEGIVASGQIQKQQEEKQLFPYQLEEAQTKTQSDKVTLDSAKLALSLQQKQLSLLNRAVESGGLGGGNTLTDDMNTMAEIALRSGDPAAAREYAATASTIDRNKQYIADQQINQQRKMAGDISETFGTVKDQASWNQSVMLFTLQHPNEAKDPHVQQLLKMPYSPELVSKIVTGTQTRLQVAETEAARQRATTAAAQAKHYSFLDRQSEAETELAEARRTRLAKAGAGNVAPSASDVKTITDLLAQDYGDPADLIQTQRFNNRALPVAERMKELIRQGMPKSEASKKAYEEGKKGGRFGGLRQARQEPGSNWTLPAALPMKGQQIDASKMRDNTVYTVNGTPMLYTGGKLYSKPEMDAAGADAEVQDDENPDASDN